MKKYLAALALASAGMVPAGVAFAQQNATVRYMTGNTAQAIEFARSQKQRYEECQPPHHRRRRLQRNRRDYPGSGVCNRPLRTLFAVLSKRSPPRPTFWRST